MPDRRSKIYARLLGGAASLALLLSSGAAYAQDDKRISIPSQSLASALHEFGVQSGYQVLFKPSSTTSKTSQGVNVDGDIDAALAQLLAGTGMSFRRAGDVFLIEPEGGSSPQAESVGDVDALIVTAQKKEEAIQDVPIAISAFSQKSLDAQKLEGGFDLLKAIPNVTFSKSNFSGYNFSIRGIGTKAVSATTDPAVAVSFNSSTLIVNRLFEQEYFDVERVEVLRGPQGTLYGRNATSGVINVISAKPRLGEFEGDLKLETGNYNAQRVKGMINIPIGDTLAIRVAGALTKRDGYGANLAASDPNAVTDVQADVDDRDLWSTRVTVGWAPNERIRVNALWEHFEEDDARVRTSKQLCHHDPGPSDDYFDSFTWNTADYRYPFARAILSQGCLPGSLYDKGTVSDPNLPAGADHGAFGTPNGASLPFVSALFWSPVVLSANPLGFNPYRNSPSTAPCPQLADPNVTHHLALNICTPDPYGALGQSRDLREIYSLIEPAYRASANIYELSMDFDLTDELTLTSQTVYADDQYYATQDYNRFTTLPIWNDSTLGCAVQQSGTNQAACAPGTYAGGLYTDLIPGGVLMDPTLGPARSLVVQDLSKAKSEQLNQEFRLASNFDSTLNFSLGANFTHFETLNDYYVFSNAFTLLTYHNPFNSVTNANCNLSATPPVTGGCVYVDPNPLESIDGEGHNYFRSANPYELTSSAIFGELYWQMTDTLKATVGARMTWDRKVFSPVPSQLLLKDYRFGSTAPGALAPEDCHFSPTGFLCGFLGNAPNGRGSPANPDIVQEWREPTGRIIVDWKPDLPFTDETMVYGSISHGYKGGGANPPSIAPPAGAFIAYVQGESAPPTFEPEFINAFEVGTKNTLLGGGLVLNGSLFYYDYKGYQVSKIVDRSASNENFDTRVWGAELEWIFSPTRNLRFNGTFGALRSEIADGEESIDLMDRTQGGHLSWTAADGSVYDEWMVLKPWILTSSNCIAPKVLVEFILANSFYATDTYNLCPVMGAIGLSYMPTSIGPGFFTQDVPGMPGKRYDPRTDAPTGGAGFKAQLGGNDLPNAPHWTTSLGAQYRFGLPGGWDGTIRGDFYWQSQSYARVYNTQYDKLRAWTNTNISLWIEQPDWGVTAEVYVKNVFDEMPITDSFLNSDDSGLTTNIFTLDPRLVGVSVRKSF